MLLKRIQYYPNIHTRCIRVPSLLSSFFSLCRCYFSSFCWDETEQIKHFRK